MGPLLLGLVTLLFGSLKNVLVPKCCYAIQGRSYRDRIATYRSDFSHAYTYGKSPFPALDGFIESIASFGNVSVFYIVDFQRAAYYQKCHDPDCQGYRSPLRPVPWDVIPELMESYQTEYQGNVVESNIENGNMNGKSIIEAGAEDPEWWEEVVKFAAAS
ncbi:unnamed protein product [Miscanthus lutarioriparius]|uniref:DNA-directed primase/polymerase protein n=1 Tax=Miscanthus lutarioriparius TaxID=422564 RepID=A0A811NH28_9POAL|nr:unnamed protein product [Miscanthus lutarioriparius]